MIFSLLLAALLTPASAQTVTVSTSPVMPTYLTLAPSLSDFTRFADGGSDGNWYIGFNNAWIVKLPPAPQGDFTKAYIGARIGRAKTRPNPDKPWVRELIQGRVYMGISQTPSFSSEQSFFLADTSDIPVDSESPAFVEGMGSAQWFWTEVPQALVSTTRPNYLIVWSPTPEFVQASSAPILAAAADEEGAPEHEVFAWNNHSILGVPPRTPNGALETPLANMSPALAIKLVPAADSDVAVGDASMQRLDRRTIVQFSVACTDLDGAWLETSRDQLDWSRVGRLIRQQPFVLSVPNAQLPPGTFVRAAARDSLGKVGYSDPLLVPYGAK